MSEEIGKPRTSGRGAVTDSKGLAGVLGLSLSRIMQLERDGIIKREAKGVWPRDEFDPGLRRIPSQGSPD